MANLTPDYTVIRREVGREFGMDTTPANWSPAQVSLVDDFIRQGLAQYYNPPPIPPNILSYEWSFLKPFWTMTTATSQREYDLPEDFEYFAGPLTYSSDDSRFHNPIEITSPQRLRQIEAASDYTSYPVYAAVYPVDYGGGLEQRQKLVLHPTPDGAYIIEAQYLAQQKMLTTNNPYPLGGPAHAHGVLASCLAKVEEFDQRAKGVRYTGFIERLQSNVAMDIRRGPRFLGYNAGGRDRPFPRGRGAARAANLIHYGDVTYNNSSWG